MELVINLFCYWLVKVIVFYFVLLGMIEVIVFIGGIGEYVVLIW